ncbi:MAG: PDZ domain-containing protein, partial [Clostridium sp.]|nr:PDZ domain-containing protein [Clostridium sp.]
MNREEKRRFVTGVLVGALYAILFFGILFAGGILLLNREVQKEAEQTSGQTADGQHDWNKIRRKLGRIQTYVDRYYIFGDRLDTQLQEEYIYKGYMAALGDVYTTYYTKEEWQEMEEQTSGAYVGIGVLVQQDKNTGLVTVMKVFAGSPALDAGMKAGDILAQVGEVDATTMDLDMLVQNHIRGEEGTDVDITVYRPDTGEYIDMTITRKTVAVETVEAKINGDIGYVSVSEFDGVSAGQFKTAIDTLQERGMKKLIVDMRNNPGGDVNTVITMTDYLLDQDQVIFSMSGKQGKERVFKSEDNHKIDIPVVVLVNGNSA